MNGIRITVNAAKTLARASGDYPLDISAKLLADEVERLELELQRQTDDYHAQLEAVHDLTETLAEERVQHAAQVERIRCELAATAARIAAWDDALGAVVPELERRMVDAAPGADEAYPDEAIRDQNFQPIKRPRLVEP